MKIALITDTHWGIRNDSAHFYDYFKRFLDDTFFKTIDQAGIKHVIHLGDLVDRRKYVNFLTANRLKTDFLDRLRDRNIECHIIAGNHDTYYKNTNKINALNELVDGKYPNVSIYTSPATVKLGAVSVLLLPWICEENYDESIRAIKDTPAQVVMGHLELDGFEMFKGSVSDHGMDHHVFDRFDVVCSGHYHHKSSTGNIHYLGAFAEFTWSDYDDPRGFHVFDTSSRELTFIQNPYKMFAKVWYDDAGKTVEEVVTNAKLDVTGKIIKVIVRSKTNPYYFDLFMDKLEKLGPIDVNVVEDHLHLDEVADETLVDEAEDTLTVCRKYISALSLNVDQKKLERTITTLYNEALQVE